MDKRPKILVVEDDDDARVTLAAVLKREGVRVEACGSLAEATAAIESRRFDLALIDIMLAGPQDRSNRDGIDVLARIKAAGEGTMTLVLSGQSDPDLVADIWQEHGADGYISKERAEREYPSYFLTKIREALGTGQPPPQARDWNSLVGALAPDANEAEFVHEILGGATFSGGLPVLRDILLDAGRWLVPLLPSRDRSPRGLKPSGPGTFTGSYWSKGQGCPVRIVLRGSNAGATDGDPDEATLLHRRTKGGLTVAIFQDPDRSRAEFGAG